MVYATTFFSKRNCQENVLGIKTLQNRESNWIFLQNWRLFW